ncbi:MAG: hypothetical protein WD049_09335 [Candidatus Paceibacterota bacterium]
MTSIFSFVAAGLVVLSVLYWIAGRENHYRIIFTPVLLFCLHEMAFLWPAAVYGVATGVSADLFSTLVIIPMMFAFLGGYILTRETIGWHIASPHEFWTRPMAIPHERARLLAIAATGGLLVAAGVFMYQGQPPAMVGLTQFLKSGYGGGAANLVSENRLDLTKGHHFGGEYRGQGAIRVLQRVGWPYLAATSTIMFVRRRTGTWAAVSLCTYLLGFVFIAGEGTRGPFLWAAISVLVAVSLQLRIKLATCISFVVALVACLVLLSLVQKLSGAASRGELLTAGGQQLIERIFIGNGINSVYVVEFVRTGVMEQRWGGIHWNDITAAVPFVSSETPFTFELFLMQNPDAKIGRTTFSSTTYFGRLYGDFGCFGTLVSYFVMGCFVAWASRVLFSMPKMACSISLIGITVMSVGQLSLNGFVYLFMSMVGLLFVAKFHQVCLALFVDRPLKSCHTSAASPLNRRLAGQHSP